MSKQKKRNSNLRKTKRRAKRCGTGKVSAEKVKNTVPCSERGIPKSFMPETTSALSLFYPLMAMKRFKMKQFKGKIMTLKEFLIQHEYSTFRTRLGAESKCYISGHTLLKEIEARDRNNTTKLIEIGQEIIAISLKSDIKILANENEIIKLGFLYYWRTGIFLERE